MRRSVLVSNVCAVLMLLTPAVAQWLKVPSNAPRGKDGKVNLTAPAPKTSAHCGTAIPSRHVKTL